MRVTHEETYVIIEMTREESEKVAESLKKYAPDSTILKTITHGNGAEDENIRYEWAGAQ